MEEIRIEVKGEEEKIKIKRTISELFGDVSFPGKEKSGSLLIRAGSHTASILEKLSKMKIVEHTTICPTFFAKKSELV